MRRFVAAVDGSARWDTVWRDSGTPVTTAEQTVIDRLNHRRTVTRTAPDQSQTVTVYQEGRLQSVTRWDGSTPAVQLGQTTYGYDDFELTQTVTDARNGTTWHTYNDADLPLTVTTPAPGNGQPAQTTTTFYDTSGRAIGVLFPDGGAQTNQYSPRGELVRTSGARTYPVGYGYDGQGRLTRMTNWTSFGAGQGERVTTWEYDGERGWLKRKRYPDTQGPSYAYSGAGRLLANTRARQAPGSTNLVAVAYSYNAAGDPQTVSYNDGTAPLSWGYDRLGRPASVLQGSGGATNTTRFYYNDAGQLTGRSHHGGVLNGLALTNQYDQCLRRYSLGANTGTPVAVTYAYDAASRLTNVTEGSDAVGYGYLANSALVGQITFRQGTNVRLTTTKAYDALNRLSRTHSTPSGANQTPVGYGYQLNAADQRLRAELADGTYWAYQYDPLGQVTSGKRYWSDGTLVAGQQFEYAFDDIGNRGSTQAGGDQSGAGLRAASYSANSLNQYTSRTVPAAVDVLGVATPAATVTVNGDSSGVYRRGDYFQKALTATNASAPQWLTVDVRASAGGTNTVWPTGYQLVPPATQTYQYDADGSPREIVDRNRGSVRVKGTRRPSRECDCSGPVSHGEILTQDGRWVYTWDGENRLIQMTNTTAVAPASARKKLRFEYDHQGRRIRKTVYPWGSTDYSATPTLDERFVYDAWNLVAELNAASTNLIRSYLWGLDLSGSEQGAGGVGGLLRVTYYGSQTTNAFVAHDGNGNVAALVDAANGNLVAEYTYGPFAELIALSGPLAKLNPLRFSTKYHDDETDLLYYGYRYYHPSAGRWLSRDPIGEEGGPNLYGFVYSNPLGYYDYLGRDGYWSDVGTTFQAMGQGALTVGKEVGSFAGDLLLGFVVVAAPECCCNSLLTKLDDIGYKGSSLTAGAGGEYGGLKTGGKVFIAPVVAAMSVPVNGYKSVQAALTGDLDAAGKKMGQALTTGGLLAAPLAKGPGGTGGYTGVGTLGEAAYNLAPTLLKTLPQKTQLAIRNRAGATCESSLIQDMGADAAQNLQIYPRLPNGELATWWFTADGVCSRNGGFTIREFKASASAPLTTRQTQAFPLLDQYGGAIRGRKGGLSIPQGTLLPPIRVQVIPQTQFQPSELTLPALGGDN